MFHGSCHLLVCNKNCLIALREVCIGPNFGPMQTSLRAIKQSNVSHTTRAYTSFSCLKYDPSICVVFKLNFFFCFISQRWMWSFYKGSPDTINFNNSWHGSQTYLDKVKVTQFNGESVLDCNMSVNRYLNPLPTDNFST